MDKPSHRLGKLGATAWGDGRGMDCSEGRLVKTSKRTISKHISERSILEMTNVHARTFLLKPESYCNLDLPIYFQFGKLLSAVSKELLGKPLTSMAGKP